MKGINAPDEAAAPELAPAQTLKDFLNGREVSRVLFVDDAFDPLDAVEPVHEEQEEIWTAIQADQEALALAIEQGLEEAGGLTASRISKLLERDDDALRRVVEAGGFVVEYRSKAQSLRFAIEYLKSIGVEVRRAGRDSWRDQATDVHIVFLDWRLGPESDPLAAMGNAVEAARELHQAESRPMIVLISSDPAVKEQARAFSLQSGLVAGLFDAMPKAWLADRTGVDLQMTVITEHLRKGHVVQGFVDGVRSRTTEAVRLYLSTLQGLTLSDFANLQHFALKKDGHPLGEYMVEILSGVWGDALFQGAMRDQLRALDQADFESLPALSEPSSSLADLYNSAVFDTQIGDISAHPHASPAEAPLRPFLSLGDVIVEAEDAEATRAYVIMNPQCDLAESPRDRRRIDDGLSVLLVPGTLHPISTPERSTRRDLADTPYFKPDGGKAVRIHWDPLRMFSVPYRDFSGWLNAAPRRRRARMRPMYALALQRTVGNQLTRIGLSAAPPMHDPIQVTFRQASGGQWQGVPEPIDQSRLVMTRDARGDQIVFTHAFLVKITEAVREGIDSLQRSTAKGDSARAGEIEAVMQDPAELQKIIKPFPAPDKSTTLLGGAVRICRESHLPAAGFDRKQLVCISIPDIEAPQ